MTLDLTKEQLHIADCYKIILTTGKILYLTNYKGATVSLPDIDGHTYTGIPITRTRINFNTDLQVDTCDISFGVFSFDIDGTSILDAINFGWFDGAQVIVFMVNPTNVGELRYILYGYINRGVKYNQKEVTLCAVSKTDLLKKTIPRLVYQVQCNHRLYDEFCGVVKASYTHVCTAASGATQSQINDNMFAGFPDTYFVLGEIKATSGQNNGARRAVRTKGEFLGVHYVTLYHPFDFPVAPGDTFEISAGCDWSGETCADKFNNYDNFLGFEYVPPPETVE